MQAAGCGNVGSAIAVRAYHLDGGKFSGGLRVLLRSSQERHSKRLQAHTGWRSASHVSLFYATPPPGDAFFSPDGHRSRGAPVTRMGRRPGYSTVTDLARLRG